MKKLLFICAAVILAASCNSGKHYTVKGNITADIPLAGRAYLFNSDRENTIRDTVKINEGQFVFEGTVESPEMFYISLDGVDGLLQIFLENDNYTISGTKDDFSNAVITGGETQTKLNRYTEANNGLVEKYALNDIIKEYSAEGTTEERKEEINAQFEEFNKESTALKDAIIAEDPVSHFALMFLGSEYYYIPVDSLSDLVSAFKADPEFAGNRTLADIDGYLQKELSLMPGNKAVDFTLNDPEGNPVTFSEFYPKNKVTMIDFWASWYGPCRAFNPTLVEIYKKYQDKGFGIIGVSLDRDRDSWLKGIEDDGLTWTHVSDLKFWQSEVAGLYNVNFIPQNTFVDAEGNIIGRKVAEDELEAFLEEHLNK